MRPHARTRFSRQINRYDAGIGDVICIAKQLLHQLAAAFAYRHGTEGSVTGMAVGTENHATAARHHFTHILVNNRDVGRHENPAIFFCS